MMFKGSFFMVLIFVAFLSPLQAQNASTESTAGFDIPHYWGSVFVPTIRQQIDVYVDTKEEKFFVPPVLLPNWGDFKQQLDVLKENEAESTLTLNVAYWSREIELQILSAVNEKLEAAKKPTVIGESDLGIVPHVFFEVVGKLGEFQETQLYLSKPASQLIAGSLGTTATIIPSQNLAVSGTKSQLSNFYLNRHRQETLRGLLYSSGYSIRPNTLSLEFHQFLSRGGEKKLFGEETFEKSSTASSSSSSSGLSVNLPLLSFGFGGGSSSVTTVRANQRVLSREYLDKLFGSSEILLKGKETGSKGAFDGMRKELIEMVLLQCEKTTVQFEKDGANSVKVGNDLIGYAQLNKIQVGELVSAARAMGMSGTDTEEVDGKPKEGKTFATNFSDNLNYNFSGDEIIPTSVDLYIVDKAKLARSIKMEFTKNVLSDSPKTFIWNFVSPAAANHVMEVKRDDLGAEIAIAQATIKANEKRIRELETQLSRGQITTVGGQNLRVATGSVRMTTRSDGNGQFNINYSNAKFKSPPKIYSVVYGRSGHHTLTGVGSVRSVTASSAISLVRMHDLVKDHHPKGKDPLTLHWIAIGN